MIAGQSVPVQETISRALKHLDTLQEQIERDRTALADKAKENDALVALNKKTNQSLQHALSSIEKQVWTFIIKLLAYAYITRALAHRGDRAPAIGG